MRLSLKIGYLTAVLAASLIAASGSSDDPRFIKFKSEMLPKVGQKITVVGTVNNHLKQPFFLAFSHWGAYLNAFNQPNAKALEAHFRHGQTVRVTGTLRYFPDPHSTREDLQARPEEFYIDVEEVTVIRRSPPAPKQTK